MISKQLLLGIGLVVGGGTLVGILNSNSTPTKQDMNSDVVRPKVEPLKQDIQTERHLSEQRKKERENNTLAQEQQAKEFVEEQERAKQQQALTKSTPATATDSINASVNSVVSEVSAILPDMQANNTNATTSTNTQANASTNFNNINTTETVVVQPRPEAIVATKKAEENKRKQRQAEQARAKQQRANANRQDTHTLVRGDSLSKLSREYGVPVSAILSANNMSSSDMLIAGDKIIIPAKGAKQRNTNTTARAEQKPKQNTQANNRQNRNNSARSVKPFYSVQVSLANDEAKAKELARQYRQAGYKVQTSKTSRGVRVLVGSAGSAEEANKLKAKLDKDSRVNSSDAWVRRVETLNP